MPLPAETTLFFKSAKFAPDNKFPARLPASFSSLLLTVLAYGSALFAMLAKMLAITLPFYGTTTARLNAVVSIVEGVCVRVLEKFHGLY